MDSYERRAIEDGYRFVAGVDEAGRGPLAGPVVAAAVIFRSPPPIHLGIKDSKVLTASKRDSLLLVIRSEAIAVGIGIIGNADINEYNILRASHMAMEHAVSDLRPFPNFLLIDGPFSIKLQIPQLPIIKGDSRSVSVAAASIVAKTTRDSIMKEYHASYPQYNFIKNKGYGTKEHLAALKKHGACPIHRTSFKGVKGL